MFRNRIGMVVSINPANKRAKVFSGVFWTVAERFSASGVSFIVSIVLARVLIPEDYGLVAMVMIFITLADVFINSGFNAALIQKKDADELDFSTVFWCSALASLLIYAVLYFAAPYVALFYGRNELVILLRVFALRVPFAVPNAIQHAYVSRNMLFKKLFFSTLLSTIISGIVGVVMALKGFGPYALIGQYFVKTLIDTVVLFFTVQWRPRLNFSRNRAKGLMGFSSAVLFADFTGQFFDQLRGLIIGRFYTSADLAYYNRGQQFPQFISSNMSAAVLTVLFPAISNESDDLIRVRAMSRRALKTMAFVFFPLMMGLACVSESLIDVLLTSKWSGSVFFMQVLSIATAVGLWGSVSLQSLKAIGKGGALVKLEIIKKPIYVALLIFGVIISVEAVAWTMLIYNFYGTIVNMRELSKHTDYKIRNQLLDVAPEIGMSFAMGFVLCVINLVSLPSIAKLLLQVCIGIGVCIVIAQKAKMESWSYIMNFVKEKVGQKNNLSGKEEEN